MQTEIDPVLLTKITNNLYVDIYLINWLVLDKEKDICRYTYMNGSCYECNYKDGLKIRKLLTVQEF